MQAMRARGHQVELIAPEASTIFRRAREGGFPVLALDDRKWRYPFTIARLARHFREQGTQVVNPHSSRDGWLGGAAARLAGVPLVVRSRHIEVDYPNRWLSRVAFHRLPHHVLTTSQKIADRLVAELGLDPVHVTCVPTGIDLARFDPEIGGVVHGELGLNPEVPLVGMVSVLRNWKGHHVFLGAARQLLDQGVQARFIVAGEGPGRRTLERRIAEHRLESHLALLGHREDVPAVLASLAVLVLPSTAHEGVPQIVLQAQAMGRAIVASRIGGIPEVIRDGETGFLVPPNDPAALAQRIRELLLDPGLRDRLGRQARTEAIRTRSLDVMCQRLEEIYGRYLPA
jgi:glycosyltransferase involved in cell wall biosynthesis